MIGCTEDFASTLRAAVEERGLGLGRIQERLAERGVSISVATLSYWQSGRSEPSVRSAHAVLPDLEAVLSLEPGTLLGVLPQTRGRDRRAPVAAISSVLTEPPQALLMNQLDTRWDAELDRVTLHDVLHIGPDRRVDRLTVRQALRARADGPDRRVIMHGYGKDVDPPELDSVRGCRVGRVEEAEDGVAIGAELLLPGPMRRGETAIVEYDLVWSGRGPLKDCYERRLRLPMRELLLEVSFHPEAAPEWCEGFNDSAVWPLGLEPDDQTHVVVTDAQRGVHGLRWAWAC